MAHREIRRSRKIILSGLAIVFALSVCCSCTDNVQFHEFRSVLNERWTQHDTLVFQLPKIPESKECDIELQLRYSTRYPYQTLYVTVIDNMEDSAQWSNKSVECTLFDERGEDTGSNTASLFQSKHFVRRATIRKDSQPLLKIIHAMNDSVIDGITDVGIKIGNCVQHQSSER